MRDKNVSFDPLLSPNGDDESRPSTSRITDPPHTRPLVDESKATDYFDYQMKFELTARIANSQWTDRDFSLMLDTLNYEMAKHGVNFEMYLTAEFLLNLLSNGQSSWSIRNEFVRKTCLTTEIILKDLKGDFIKFGDKMILSEKTLKTLQDGSLIITKRVYSSRRNFFRAERFVTLRAVPLKQHIQRRKDSERYSSYTRGYGEGGSASGRKKTRYSSELDGDDRDRPLNFSILDFAKYQTILLLKAIQKSLYEE